MQPTVTIEIPAEQEALVRQFLAFREEMEQLALTAPDGQVLDVCEQAVIQKGREITVQVLSDAVARRVEAAEKKGLGFVPAHAAGRRRTVASIRVSS